MCLGIAVDHSYIWTLCGLKHVRINNYIETRHRAGALHPTRLLVRRCSGVGASSIKAFQLSNIWDLGARKFCGCSEASSG